MASKKKATKKVAKKAKDNAFLKDLICFVVIAFSFFLELSVIMPGKTGVLGNMFYNILTGLFSVSAYLFPIFILALATNYVIEKRIYRYTYIFVCSGLLILIISAIMQCANGEFLIDGFWKNVASFYKNGAELKGGGVFGGIIHYGLSALVGDVGSLTIYITGIVLSLAFIFKISLSTFFRNTYIKLRNSINEHKAQKLKEKEEKALIITGAEKSYKDDDDINDFEVSDEDDMIIGPGFPIPPEKPAKESIDTIIDEDNQVSIATPVDTENFTPDFANDYLIENYVFPDVDMLKYPKKSGKAVKEQDLMNNARKLIDTLSSFGVQSKILQVSKGPAITRYELQPIAGVRVSKIVGLADDIALNLAASGVRIEAPIPGKAAIGIEVPNSDIDTVSMREVIDCDEFKNHPSKLAVALGKDISGAPVIIDLAKMPHLLIAGATGSGKSVCINSIITSIMYKANPNEVKLLLIDPKVVELSVYNGIPHLDTPVVTKAKKAAGALSWAVTEMMKRYEQFSENKVKDIKGYNALMKDKGYPIMPQVVIIIDELADLMMVAPNEVEDHICRLAQLARAAGMHLVIATQRPSVNVITGIIKANIPSRIAFAVSSQIDSRTILDSAGAEKLLGRGDMLYHPAGSSKPQRIQGAFVSENEVDSIVKFVKNNAEASYNPDIIEHIESASASSERTKGDSEEQSDYDDMLPKAIDIVMELGQASTSMIQRKLSVGYARAGRIMDQMEERGIVGPSEGSKPRQILLTHEQYLELKNAGIFEKPTEY